MKENKTYLTSQIINIFHVLSNTLITDSICCL